MKYALYDGVSLRYDYDEPPDGLEMIDVFITREPEGDHFREVRWIHEVIVIRPDLPKESAFRYFDVFIRSDILERSPKVAMHIRQLLKERS